MSETFNIYCDESCHGAGNKLGQGRFSAFLGIKWQKVKPDTGVTPRRK
jgi:hypothetical protein